MQALKILFLISVIIYLPVTQAWDDETYQETDEYADQSDYNNAQGISSELIYQLAAERQIQAMQDEMLDDARHQQNLQYLRERGEQWAKSFKNPYMD